MTHYRVTWKIDIEADDAIEAAAKALIIQRDNDPANSATVFEVERNDGTVWNAAETIDLSEPDFREVDEETCPVHRQPVSRCPATCDHGDERTDDEMTAAEVATQRKGSW